MDILSFIAELVVGELKPIRFIRALVLGIGLLFCGAGIAFGFLPTWKTDYDIVIIGIGATGLGALIMIGIFMNLKSK